MWRDLPVRYPEEGVYSRSGEDSALLESLISQVPVAGLRGRGFLSIYTYHGANTFDLQHHRQLALYRGADRTFIEDHRIALRRALAAYCLPRSPKITFKASGQEVFNLQTRQRRAILIYNRMFGEAPNLESVEGMERYEFTEDRSRYDEAVAVIFHIPDLPDTTHLRKRPGQIWVAWSMECEANYPQLVDAEFMAPFDLRMAYPLRSDINVNYVPTTLYEGEVGLDHPKSSTRLACSWISGLVDNSGREEYLRELARYMEIHFYGSQGDRVLENDQGRPTKLSVVGTYKFDLAFENTLAQDYVTEKFFDPLVAGTVPVYLGAPNVIDFAPTDHCFLDVRHYPRPADLAERLLELDRDDESYAQLVNWRSQPPRPGFREFYSVATSCPFRRLCDTLDEIWKQGEVEP
ncbi:MAG: glycosyltransferase family 10 [Acidobacteriota bacterium]